jgi:hypothetical protein
MTDIKARDFCLAVSVTDLLTWEGSGDGDPSENEALKTVLKALGITVELRAVYADYFDQTTVGSGDVHVYRPTKDSKNVFAVDLYRDSFDQMDLVTLAVGCDAHCLPVVRSQLRAFFDAASCQVHYEEASYSARLRRMIDPKTYPVTMEDSGYAQQMHEVHG